MDFSLKNIFRSRQEILESERRLQEKVIYLESRLAESEAENFLQQRILADVVDRLVRGAVEREKAKRTIGIYREIIRRAHRREKELKEENRTDPLTGLGNRRSLDRVSKNLRGSEKKSQFIMVIDLDHFGQVNKTFGMPAGDQVLKATSGGIKEICRRDTDVVCRVGGEEFIIISEHANEIEARKQAEQVCVRIESGRPLLEYPDFFITASVGIASFDGESLESAIDKADRALRLAKQSGRNCVKVYREVAESQ